jgi:hypothetical protein
LKKTGTFFLKRDDLPTGLVVGIFAPFLVFIAIYFIRFSGYTVDEFFRVFLRENRLITFFGVWCLVGNVALFTYYINTHRDRTAKGIFGVTLVYGVGILLLKLFN